MNEPARVLNATRIIGNKVVNPVGEQLGVIKDLMIDLDDEKIAYVVLSFGGFLGRGGKLFAIPLEALAFTAEHSAVLEMSRKELQKTPGFDRNHWPEDAQHETGWLLDLYEHYGYSPYRRPDK